MIFLAERPLVAQSGNTAGLQVAGQVHFESAKRITPAFFDVIPVARQAPLHF